MTDTKHDGPLTVQSEGAKEDPVKVDCTPEGVTGHPVWEEPETHRPAVCQDRGLDRHHSESRYR